MSEEFNWPTRPTDVGGGGDGEGAGGQCEHPSHSRFHFSEQNRNGLSWWCIDCGALALGDYQKKVRLVGPTMQEHLGYSEEPRQEEAK